MSQRYRVGYTARALKELGKIDKAQVRRVRRFFEETLDLSNPRSRGRPWSTGTRGGLLPATRRNGSAQEVT